jgi:hypothetical protein
MGRRSGKRGTLRERALWALHTQYLRISGKALDAGEVWSMSFDEFLRVYSPWYSAPRIARLTLVRCDPAKPWTEANVAVVDYAGRAPLEQWRGPPIEKIY